jgi:hypothetical protein
LLSPRCLLKILHGSLSMLPSPSSMQNYLGSL